MPQADAASARDEPSSTRAIASIRQASRPSELRDATRRSCDADSSSRVTSILAPMLPSAALHRPDTLNRTLQRSETQISQESGFSAAGITALGREALKIEPQLAPSEVDPEKPSQRSPNGR